MSNKTFRLFISSTFNDFRREREVLQTKVFPKIKDYASKHGYTFQPIDLRWGISNEAQLDQKTLELCLSEVRACKTYIHPNFLIMIGDRYGWIPLPYEIEKDEFEQLMISSSSNDDINSILKWYKLDNNHIPASYILVERTGRYRNYDRWLEVENSLKKIFHKLLVNSSLSMNVIKKYFLSATEAEVEEGIIPYIMPTDYQNKLLQEDRLFHQSDAEHIFGFFRDIDITTQIENKFITDDYDEAQQFKKRVSSTLPDDNILHVKTTQKDKNDLDEIYLQEFQTKITKFLKQKIDLKIELEKKEHLTELELEIQAQENFAKNKCKNFLGQEKLRTIISNYLIDRKKQALVVCGESGKGKSALIAKAIEEAQQSLHKKIVYRFIGATSNSYSSKKVLTSIFEELGINLSHTSEQKNEESFESFSKKIHDAIKKIQEEVVIFIDAIDQLQNHDYFTWLPEELPLNVKIVLSTLEDAKYLEDSQYLQSLKIKTSNIHVIDDFNQPQKLLKELLYQENRTIHRDQEKYFLERYNKVKTPLYITIATQKIKNHKNNDKLNNLADTQVGVIRDYINDLTKLYHHDERFVHKVLAYIFASQDGVSESELLQLFNIDKEFVKFMADEQFHQNYTLEFPLVHWSRLQMQLKPFLNLKKQDGEELISFFHREFEDVIENLANQNIEHKSAIKATQKLLEENQDNEFGQNRWGKLYFKLVIKHYVKYQNESDLNTFSMFIATLKNQTWLEEYIYVNEEQGTDYINSSNSDFEYAYTLHFYLILKHLNKQDRRNWSDFYLHSIHQLSNFYRNINELDKAMYLEDEALKLTDTPKDANEYLSKAVSLSDKAQSYLQIGDLQEALSVELEAYAILKTLYSETIVSEGLIKVYFSSLMSLTQIYANLDKTEQAFEMNKDALSMITDLYNRNESLWVEQYTTALANLAILYKKADMNKEAIDISEKELKIIQTQYNQDQRTWIGQYSTSLVNVATLLHSDLQISKAMLYLDTAVKLFQELYSRSKKRWGKQYVNALTLLSLCSYDSNDFQKCVQDNMLLLSVLKNLCLDDPDKWYTSYTDVFDDLLHVYHYKLSNNIAIIELDQLNLTNMQELYSKHSNEFLDEYLKAVERVANFYIDTGNIEVMKEFLGELAYHIGDEHPFLLELEKRAGLFRESNIATFMDVLMLASFISQALSQDSCISRYTIYLSLDYFELDDRGNRMFTHLFTQEQMNSINYKSGGQDIVNTFKSECQEFKYEDDIEEIGQFFYEQREVSIGKFNL